MIADAAVVEDDKLSRCSREANLVYDHIQRRGTDDWARSELNPRKLVARLFPRRTDVREGHIRRWLEEYERAASPLDPSGHGLLRPYVVGGVPFLEFTTPSPRRRRLMFCPPPPWASERDHTIWKAKGAARSFRGASTGQPHDTLPLPLGDPLPTPLHDASMDSESYGDTRRPSPLSPFSPRTNDPPLPPACAGGLVVDLAGLPEPLRQIAKEANDGLRTPESATKILVEEASRFVVSIDGLATPDVRRSLRRALRAGLPLAKILEGQAERVKRDLWRRGAFNHAGGEDPAGEWDRRVAAAAAAIGVSISTTAADP